MVLARSEGVIDGVEGGYHVVTWCVRRAFLCGEDDYTGRSYEHRKEWVRDRLEELASGFAIEICAYSIMSNYVHVVLRTRPIGRRNGPIRKWLGAGCRYFLRGGILIIRRSD